MLISIVLTLVSDRPATLPGDTGRACGSEALARISAHNPGLAAELHAAEPKQITCSGVVNGRPAEGNLTVCPTQRYHVRITGLTEAAGDGLAAAFLQNPPDTWTVGGHVFHAIDVACDPARDPWSGCTGYAALAAGWLRPKARPSNRVTLDFVSPVVFTSNAMSVPVPLPGLVFGSLAERWNAFSPAPIDGDARDFFARNLAISHYRLHSRAVVQKNGALRIGGVGRATYLLLADDPYWRGVLQILADFVLYAGVGAQTASGMGQCRKVEAEHG